jgi:hypothetical protein
MPRSPSARCIHDLGIASAPIVFSGGSRRLRSGSCSPGREKSGGSGSCPRALPSRSRLHYALEWTDDQWAGSAWQRFVSHPPESAPAEACLKREACMRCYELWFGSAMTHCPQKARNISNGCGHRRTTVLRYATAASCANGQGALSHGCHRIAQNFSSRCPRAQLRRDEENAC